MKNNVLIRLITLALALVMSFGMTAFAAQFPDINESHWAFSAVSELVSKGTINGFEDGTFRPEATVTRAQFVKMMGVGSVRSEVGYFDVTADHWGYEYIMTSEEEGSDFHPDRAITRDEALVFLWKRAQRPANYIAPGIITEQSSNKVAASWGYTTGLMIGNDGLNLRLSETLTRAEAAMLIVRASNGSGANDFVNTVSEDILKMIATSTVLFEDFEYQPDKLITNGEVARAALRFGEESADVTYRFMNSTPAFEHEYAKDWTAVCDDIFGAEKATAANADAYATIGDTLAMFSFNALRRTESDIKIGTTETYPDMQGKYKKMAQRCISGCYENDIRLYATDALNADKQITAKELMCLILQLDNLYSINRSYGDTIEKTFINKNLYVYPANKDSYAVILEGVPAAVYEKPLDGAKDFFATAYQFKSVFTTFLGDMRNICKGKVNLKFYPSLATQGSTECILRVECQVIDNSQGLGINDMFAGYGAVEGNPVLQTGTTVWLDIATGQKLSDLVMLIDNAKIISVIY